MKSIYFNSNREIINKIKLESTLVELSDESTFYINIRDYVTSI